MPSDSSRDEFPTNNPFAAPLTETNREDEAAVMGGDEEATRRRYIDHEASIKSVGMLYYIGAAACIVYFVVIGLGFIGLANDGIGEDTETAVLILAVLGIVAVIQGFIGHHLRRLSPGVRIWAILLATIGLLGFPVGTLINLYILYLLAGEKGKFVLSTEYQQIVAATPHVKRKTSIIVKIFLGLLLVVILLGVVALIVGSFGNR